MKTTETPLLEELGLLDGFLGLFAAEVTPHAREDLTEEQKSELRRLAAGELDDASRKKLVPLLARNEVAMEFLAEVAG